MSRSTMSSLISTLRGMTNAGTADYTIAGSAYWTGDQLQTVLDRYSIAVREEPLTSFSVTISGTVTWKDYQSNYRWFETTDGGTARFTVSDGQGNNQGTANWSADYERGLVTFGSNTGGSALYLTGYAYDVYAAAADVWRQKASQYAITFDFTTDNHSVKRSHIAGQCERMANYYASLASTGANGSGSGTTERSDLC
jgi:hypothetical protein